MTRPAPTSLSHETAGVGKPGTQLYDPRQGGWDVEDGKFYPVKRYAAFQEAVSNPKAPRVAGLLLLDAITAAVEAGQLDSRNAHTIFETSADWLVWGDDVRETAAEYWLNERHFHAIRAITGEYPGPTYETAVGELIHHMV